MNQTSRPAAAVAAFALSAFPLLFLPSAAAADPTPGGTKAGVEHAERLAAEGDRPSKAQIEQRERSTSGAGEGGSRQQQSPSMPSSSGDNGAAAWQLALSVAFGATLTGGVVLASRHVSNHRRVVAP